jgi:hypothetical protein
MFQRPGFTKAAAVVQHNTNQIAPLFTAKAIYCGGATAADLKVTTAAGSTVTFTGVQPGTILPIAQKVIFDTGTTFADADLLVLGD